MDAIRRLLGNYRYTAIAVVTVLTLGIVGAVVLTTTSAGCGPANRLGLKTTACISGGKVGSVSGIPSPTPQRGAKGGPTPTFQPSTPPVVQPGATPTPTPTPTPNWAPNAPYNPAASGAPPYQNLASSGAPPLATPASSNGWGGTFSCRLPVYAGGPGSGGFVVLPDETFIADPRSAVTVPMPSTGWPSPAPGGGYGQPQAPGWFGETYDAKYSKWLAVPYAWVSPDGSHYAYPLGGEIYVQNVANGSQLELASGKGYLVLTTANDGVYVTTPNQPGLWFLPYSGASKQVATAGFWQGVANGFAYGTTTSSVPPGASNTIERLDIAGGTVAPYFSDQGQSQLIGFDPLGNPVIRVQYNNGAAIFIGTGPNTAVGIASEGPYYYPPQGPFPWSAPLADSHGLWFSVGNGIVLYRNLGWYWMSSIGGQLAGPCV